MQPVDVAVLGAVFAGALTQRVTGLGFALVAAPFLVLVLGPFEGVLLSNLLSLAVSVVVLAFTWRHLDAKRTAMLTAPALATVPIGAWVAQVLPAALLLVVVGGLVLLGLLAVLASRRARVFRGTKGVLSAGALSGFMNASAGVGGPAVTLYALSTDWRQPTFLPSIQCYFAVVSVASLTAKGLPDVPGVTLLMVFAALGLGLGAGQLVSRWVSPDRARTAVSGIAVLGAAGTVVKGLLSW